MHFQRQYQEANIVLPELTEQSSTEEHLIYMKRLNDRIGRETNVLVAALAENHIYWSLASCLIAFALWFPVTWLGSKFEAR